MNAPDNYETARIERLFADLDDDALETAFDTYESYFYGVGWTELLRSPRVLIVSEAGVGKTYECQTEQRRLWDAGESAFFVELSELGRSDLESALIKGSPEHARFLTWRQSESGEATFFLDSLDELKLQRQDFGRALRTLAAGVSGQLSRVRIVITTRPTSIDVRAVKQLLPVPRTEDPLTAEAFADLAMGNVRNEKSNKQPPEWRQVRLLPLTDAQIREFSAVQGIDDVDGLMRDIEDRRAEEFARRPQDLIELCADWKAHRRIRRHAEQLDSAISIKLTPRNDRQEITSLSESRAREGAARLALAALLTRKFRIRLPGEQRHHESTGALDPALLLPDWTDKERETLLQRPLFGFVSYGEVRFQHRTIIEYLAAERLDTYFRRNMSSRAILRLLLTTTLQGIRVVKPTMRPVAAWLAQSYSNVFNVILNHEPDILLTEGDPQSLSSSQRKAALRAYVVRHGSGRWRGLEVPWLQAQRFTNPDLAPIIRELWPNVENPDVRTVLLHLIEAGRLVECADLVYETAIDSQRDSYERLNAIDALASLGDARVDSIVQAASDNPSKWDDWLVRGMIRRLFPKDLSVSALDRLLGRVSDEPEVQDSLQTLATQIRDGGVGGANLEELITILLQRITSGLRWSAETDGPTSSRLDLLAALIAACELSLKEHGPTPLNLKAAAIAARLSRHSESERESDELRGLLQQLDPSSREFLIASHDEFTQSVFGKPRVVNNRHIELLAYGAFDLKAELDQAWVLRIVGDTARKEEDRELYLAIGMMLAWRSEHVEEAFEHLRSSIRDSSNLLSVLDKELVRKEADPEIARIEEERLRRREKTQQKNTEVRAGWIRFRDQLSTDPDTLLTPEAFRSTTFDLWSVMSKLDRGDKAAGWSRGFLEQSFGAPFADQMRDVLMKFWRQDTPTLRSERPAGQRGTFYMHWRTGLAGIYAEAEDRDWPKNLTAEDARRAARYAPLAMNELPSWLDDLAPVFPHEIDEVLGNELSIDLAETEPKEMHGILLQSLGYATSPVVSIFLPRLLHWLNASQPLNLESNQTVDRLHRVIALLLDHGDENTKSDVASFVRKELVSATDEAVLLALLPVLARIDPEECISHLEQIASTCVTAQSSIMVKLIGAMLGDRFARQTFELTTSTLTIDQKVRLLRMTYRHVIQDHDMNHRGAYSPGLRDSAETARRGLLKALLESRGAEAWVAKIELASDPLFSDLQDRIRAIALETSANEADQATLDEREVHALEVYGEAPPTTRDDMFALMADRIDDLEDLLLQDTSPRAAWALIQREEDMRPVISHELRNRANSAYLIDQESVTADNKETDIRLRSTRMGQEGVIELKVGDQGWSVNDLRTALKDQLVKQYMAPEQRRAGCLLITLARDKKWKHPATGEILEFEAMIELLQRDASELVEQMGGSIRLMVRGLDLRPRLVK